MMPDRPVIHTKTDYPRGQLFWIDTNQEGEDLPYSPLWAAEMFLPGEVPQYDYLLAGEEPWRDSAWDAIRAAMELYPELAP
jgi:hypothetical protein